MELDTVHRMPSVSETHDEAVVGFGVDLEVVRQRLTVHDKGMVTASIEWCRQTVVDAAAVMVDGGGFPVHQFWGGYYVPPVRLANALMPQAHAQ